MTTLLPKLNSDLGEWADRVRQSLVHMSVGRKGSGSGVVFASDGLVVTNAHVLSGGRGHSSQTCEFQVTMPRGTVVKSVLLGKDDDIDVAVLQIEQAGGQLPEFSPIGMGDSRNLRAGQWVMAMGHPWGGSHRDSDRLRPGPARSAGQWKGMGRSGPGVASGTFRRTVGRPPWPLDWHQ